MAIEAIKTLQAHYRTAIDKMPATFTSHEFILKLAQAHQREYVEALSAYSESGEPFQAVHQQLSSHLRTCSDQVLHDGTASSHDIFGNANSCSKWKKL